MIPRQEPLLYLSSDKKYLTDDKDSIISMRQEYNEMSYYQVVGIESEAYEKVCTEIRSRKVCVVWNDLHECQVWDEVDVCTKWELIAKGRSNIS